IRGRNDALTSKLANGCGGEYRAAGGLMQSPHTSFCGSLFRPRAQMSGNQRAALARVKQDQRLLRLDAVGEPVLQPILADALVVQCIGAALVVLRDQIEAPALRLAMRCSKQHEGVAWVNVLGDLIDNLVELVARC